MLNSKLKYQKDFLEECIEYIETLKDNLINSANGNYSISFGKKITSSNSLDALRILYETKASNESSRILRNAILEMVLSSRLISRSSTFYAALSFCEFFLYKTNKKIEIKNDLKNLCSKSQRTNLDTAVTHLRNVSKNDKSFKILKTLIKNANFNTSLLVKNSDAWESKIKINSSFEFNSFIHQNFSIMAKTNNLEFQNCDFLVIDGVVESVGELHHIFELYNKNKKKLCIIARGFQEEVIATMATNFLRKTLFCIPIVVPNNLQTINSFKDIAIVSNSDMISSLKGETISSIKPEQIGKVDYVNIDSYFMRINNPSQNSAVESHIIQLRKKMEDQNEDIRRLLEQRIISLSPNSATIFLGKNLGESSGLIKDRLNLAIGTLNSTCRYGIINLEDISSLSCKPIDSVINILKYLGFKYCPAEALVDGIKVSAKTSQSIKSSAAFILLD